jgi:hypothetical protein
MRFGACAVVLGAVLGCSDDSADTGSGGAGGAPCPGGTGGGSTNDWSCLGSVGAPMFMAGTAVGRIAVVEFLDGRAMPDVNVDVCAADDSTCAMPLAMGTTDAQGLVTLDVTTAEQRYLSLEGPGMLPTVSFNNGPPRTDPFDETVRVIAPGTFAALEALLMVSGDPTRGHAGVYSADCLGAPGVGVTFEVSTADASTTFGYFDEQGTPDPTILESTENGSAAIANLPEGPAVLTATVKSTCQVIGTRTFFVRAGTIAYPACVEPELEAP